MDKFTHCRWRTNPLPAPGLFDPKIIRLLMLPEQDGLPPLAPEVWPSLWQGQELVEIDADDQLRAEFWQSLLAAGWRT